MLSNLDIEAKMAYPLFYSRPNRFSRHKDDTNLRVENNCNAESFNNRPGF